MNAEIVAYDPARDGQAVAALWAELLGASWPMSAENLAAILACPLPTQRPLHLVARVGGALVGFVGAQFNEDSSTGSRYGNIMAVLVAPGAQRKGLGRRLVEAALAGLREAGAKYVQLGGKFPRIWPGVPTNLPDASAFFRACGWEFDDEAIYDLTRNLKDYTLPDEIRARMAGERITIEPAREADVPEVLALHRREFPYWVDTCAFIAGVGDHADILVARDPERGIVGSLNMFGAWSHPSRRDAPFRTMLGGDLGGLGEVGVSERERGRGIGVALVAYGSQVIKERGAGNAFIGWTTLARFYAKLGYAIWKDYRIGYKQFA